VIILVSNFSNKVFSQHKSFQLVRFDIELGGLLVFIYNFLTFFQQVKLQFLETANAYDVLITFATKSLHHCSADD